MIDPPSARIRMEPVRPSCGRDHRRRDGSWTSSGQGLRSELVGLGLLCLAALASPAVGSAQTPQGGDSVLAAPRMSYDAHPLRAAMMGRGWRELWRV